MKFFGLDSAIKTESFRVWAVKISILILPFIYFFYHQIKQNFCTPSNSFNYSLITTSWIDQTVDREFQAFQATGISREMLENTWARVHKLRRNMKRYQIISNKVYGEDSNLKRFLEKMVLCYEVPDVDFIYYAGDRLQPSFFRNGRFALCAPIFVSAKRHFHDRAILFCDSFYNIEDEKQGWNAMIAAVEEAHNKSPWQKKKEQLFWRGSPNDGHYQIDRWKEFPRGQLIYQSQKFSDLINAAFSHYPYTSKNPEADFEKVLGPISFVSLSEQMNYKYQIIIDGVTTPFTGSYWKLLSGCLSFKQESKDIMFFHGPLHPWIHYIPVKNDLSDLIEKIRWAQEHDQEAEQIAKNARTFAQNHLMPEQMLFYCYKILLRYAQLQRFHPTN